MLPSEMPKGHARTSCKGCERPIADCGTLSTRGLCALCGEMRWTENLLSLKTHSGPYFAHYRRRSLAALGVIVLDEPESGR